MNAFICFCQAERKKFKNGKLLAEWRKVHKGLGKKWTSLGKGKAKYYTKKGTHPFSLFIKEFEPRQKLLPEWIRWHRGLGNRWRQLEKSEKEKFITASLKMKKN